MAAGGTTEEQTLTETFENKPLEETSICKVENMPLSFTEEKVIELFAQCGKVESVSLKKVRNAKSRVVFVTFETVEASKAAVAQMNNRLVGEEDDKKRIGVISAPPRNTTPKTYEDGEESPRLHVRELDYNVKKPELREAFVPFSKSGQIKCKLIKTRNGKSRGYAFIEYDTTEEAKAAKEAMDKKEIRERAIMVLFSKSEGPRQSNKKKNRKKKARAQQPAAETAVATETVEANTETKETNQAGGKPKRGKRRRRRRENNNRRKQQAAPAEEKTEEEAAAGGTQERRVGRNRRVFVKNLAANTTEETLQSVFSSYGTVARVNLPKEKDGDAIRGFAFVTYDQPEDAFKAKQAENVECGGNALQIFWAQPRRFRGRGRRGQNAGGNRD